MAVPLTRHESVPTIGGMTQSAATLTEIDYHPIFSPEAQEVFLPGCRVFEPGTGREAVYVGRKASWSNSAIVTYDGDDEPSVASYADIRNTHH